MLGSDSVHFDIVVENDFSVAFIKTVYYVICTDAEREGHIADTVGAVSSGEFRIKHK